MTDLAAQVNNLEAVLFRGLSLGGPGSDTPVVRDGNPAAITDNRNPNELAAERGEPRRAVRPWPKRNTLSSTARLGSVFT